MNGSRSSSEASALGSMSQSYWIERNEYKREARDRDDNPMMFKRLEMRYGEASTMYPQGEWLSQDMRSTSVD